MFPVRRELVGKRFAFIHGDGRTGTRKRGSHTGLSQNWNELNWVTGTILAANVDGLDAQEDSIISKKVKVFVQYDSHYQLQKEWIKLYSGSHRIFFVEENLVLCRRKGDVGCSSQGYGWPALRLVPIVDRNFMDENPHLIPVEYMGARKQLSFIAFEDIVKLFPDEDQSLLLQSLQQDPYLKSDYQSWERTQKTQMILLYGPYSLTGCRVEVNNPSHGRCYRAVIISHDYLKRVLDVMDDQLLKSQKVNPKLIQVNFLASDEDIDKLMYGEAPKAIPTRYSRYGHQVHPPRCQANEMGPTNHQSSHFTLPQWMASLNFMGQDQNSQISHSDYQEESAMQSNELSTVMKHGDGGKLDTSPTGLINVSDQSRPVADIQNGMRNQVNLSSRFNDTQHILKSDAQLEEHRSARSSEPRDSSKHCVARFRPAFESHLQHSPVLSLPSNSTLQFGPPVSSNRLRTSCPDQPVKDLSIEAQCSDAMMMMCYAPSSTVASPQGQACEVYATFCAQSHDPDSNLAKSDEYMQLGCYQSRQYETDILSEKAFSAGLSNSKFSPAIGRSFPESDRMPSVPKNFEVKTHQDLQLQSSDSLSASSQRVVPYGVQYNPEEQQNLQLNESLEGPLNSPELNRTSLKVDDGCLDRTVQSQSLHQSIKSQSMSIDQDDFAHFLKHLDACFSGSTRAPQHIESFKEIKNFSSSSSRENFQSTGFPFDSRRSNPDVQEDYLLAFIQERFSKLYPHSEPQEFRTLQGMYEQFIKKHISLKHGMIALNQSHDFASSSSSYMTRSLSSDNFQIGSGQFSISPSNAPLKKLRGKVRRKARSKDDTSKPSPEASRKFSSLLLSCKNRKDGDRDETDAMEKMYRRFIDTSRKELTGVNENKAEAASSAVKELIKEKRDKENFKNPGDHEDKAPFLRANDKIVNQDATARLALAFAGFSNGVCHNTHFHCTVPYTAVQKIPTDATWIEDVRNELSNGDATVMKTESNVHKKALGKANDVLIDAPPSPEFLPKKDKEAESVEDFKTGSSKSSAGSSKQVKSFIGSSSEDQKDSMENGPLTEFNVAPELHGSECVSIATDSLHSEDLSTVSKKNELTNGDEKQLNEVENNIVKRISQSSAVADTSFDHADNALKETGFSKIPISSVSAALLGIHLGKSSGVSEKYDSNETEVVRNIYGRTLYQKAQRGPSVAQQLRTDKIIGVISSSELQNDVKLLPEPCLLEEPPVSRKIKGDDSLAPLSDLKQMLQTKKPLLETSSGLHVPSTVLLSPKHEMTTSLFKNDQITKALSEREIKHGEKKAKKTICKHKRKPCKCDLEQTFASLVHNAPVSYRKNATFQSLQRLTTQNSVRPRIDSPVVLPCRTIHQLSSLNQEPKIPGNPQNSITQFDCKMNGGLSPSTEQSFSILESKEMAEKPSSQYMQSPKSNALKESQAQPLPTQKMDLSSDSLHPMTLESSSSLNYSRSFEPRNSEKCKHKRRPCRCDINAAVELSAYIEHQNSNGASESPCSSVKPLMSGIKSSSNPVHNSLGSIPHMTFHEEKNANDGINLQTPATDVNAVDDKSFGIQNCIEDKNAPILCYLPSTSADLAVVQNFKSDREKDLPENTSQVSILENPTSERDFMESDQCSVLSSVVANELTTKSDYFVASSKQFSPLDSAFGGKILLGQKCRHGRKPCKCNNAEGFNTDSMENAVGVLSSNRKDGGFGRNGLEVEEFVDKPENHISVHLNYDHQEHSKEFGFSCNDSDGIGPHRDVRCATQECSKLEQHDVVLTDLSQQNEKNDLMLMDHGINANGNTEKLLRETGYPKVLDNKFCNSVGKTELSYEDHEGEANQVNVEKTVAENLEELNILVDSNNLHVSVAHEMEAESENSQVTLNEIPSKGIDVVRRKSLCEEVTKVVKLKERRHFEMGRRIGKRRKAMKASLDSEIDIPIADGKGGVVMKRNVNLTESRNIDKGKGTLSLNETSNLESVGCEQEIIAETNVNQELSVENEVGKQNESKALKGTVESGSKSTANRHCVDEISSMSVSSVQLENTSVEKTKPLLPNSSLKISVPAHLPISSSMLNAPGNRFTARAKIACPEKNLEPLKGAPVNVSFDGGKTFALANIVEIRNKSNHSHSNESQERVAASKEKSNERQKFRSGGVIEKPTTIDAVLLGYSTSELSRKDVIEKEDKTSEKKPCTTRKKKNITGSTYDTDNSSDEDADDPYFVQKGKETSEQLRPAKKSCETHKELRRSSRFAMKSDANKEIWDGKGMAKEVRSIMSQSIHHENASNAVLSEADNEEKLSSEGLSLTGANGKTELGKTPIDKSIEAAGSTCETRVWNGDDFMRTTQTSKDEMFDCCAIHQNLFCHKCLPFKKKEGHWPVSSRSKEINAAWRRFVQRCSKHDCSKCEECYDIEKGLSVDKSHDVYDGALQDRLFQEASNKTYKAHKEAIEKPIPLKKMEHFGHGKNELVPRKSIGFELGMHDVIEDKTESIESTSRIENTEEADRVDTRLKGKSKANGSIVIEKVLNQMNAGLLNEKEEDISELGSNSMALGKESEDDYSGIGSAEASKKVLTGANAEGGNKEKAKAERENGDIYSCNESKKLNAKRNLRLKLNHTGMKVVNAEEGTIWQEQPATEGRKEPPSGLALEAVIFSDEECLMKSNVARSSLDLPVLQLDPTETNNSRDCCSGDVPSQNNSPSKKCTRRSRKPSELGVDDKTEGKDVIKDLKDNDDVLEPFRKEEMSAFSDSMSSIPDEKCLIHGRKTCAACKPFYEKDGKWPRWARRGEVRFLWESMNKEKTKINTVKCRIHLRGKCPKCLPFRDENGIWPSWLQRDLVEGHYEKTDNAENITDETHESIKYRNTSPSLEQDYICEIHSKYFCVKCYEIKLKTGKWPIDAKFVERECRERQKKKTDVLSVWNRCEIHQDQICLPCFYFWRLKGRAPYDNDEQMVDQIWKTVAAQLSRKHCEIHRRYFCQHCTPIFLSGEEFPNAENHLKSIYSWKLFEDLLKQYPTTVVTEENQTRTERRGKYARKSKRDQLLKKIDAFSQNISKKFHCTLHESFPCFVCMPKFVADSCWPNEEDCHELWQGWVDEHPEYDKCVAHGKLFCDQCHDIACLFDKFHKPGVTDVFLELVKEDLDSQHDVFHSQIFDRTVDDINGPGLHKKTRKRKRGCSNRDSDPDVDPRSEHVSVSSKGRVRSKVSRPGTVDISKLSEDFIDKECKKEHTIICMDKGQKKKNRTMKNDRQMLRKQLNVSTQSEPIKRKRGRPRKKLLDSEESAPKKRKRRRRKNGLVEQVRSGTLKIINVDNLRDQLENERERDPSPAHMEYIQLLENAEKMNVKYFAISVDCNNVIEKDILKKEQLLVSEDREDALELDCGKVSNSEVGKKDKKDDATGGKHLKEVVVPNREMWSERDIELILQKVEKVAEAAKMKKEEALHRKKQRQRKKPLTVAQVLAIKRKRSGDVGPVMDENAREDLEKMLKEAERRRVDLDTLLDEAIKTKDNEERRKTLAKQKAKVRAETFLQEKPCDQTPKLPKCRDCRIVDKRNADQHAFCRFVMFRRLFKRPKTGKVESAGFCSPESADHNAFIPWAAEPSDVDMKASVCHYIIKNIAGQFCAVVEEECQALMLGTKDGAVAWKRAVPGVREMCDACATTVFNIHWVCEKCGFGVCLDCFKSKISEKEIKDKGYRAFEFVWSSCAPGLSHKPANLTVTQIIPKDALWDVCLKTVDICESLSIPYRLSENVLKKALVLDDCADPYKEKAKCVGKAKSLASTEDLLVQRSRVQQGNFEHSAAKASIESSGLHDMSEDCKVEHQTVKASLCVSDNVQPSSVSPATIYGNPTSSVTIPSQVVHSSARLMKPLTFLASNDCSTGDKACRATSMNMKSDPLTDRKAMEVRLYENEVLSPDYAAKIESTCMPQSTNHLNFAVPLIGESQQKLAKVTFDRLNDDDNLYYSSVCNKALSVLDRIRKWKSASKLMKEVVKFQDDSVEEIDTDCNQKEVNAIDCGNDSLLSDISMASDDAEMLGDPVGNGLVVQEKFVERSSKAVISPLKPDHVLADTVKKSCESESDISLRKQFSPPFQNSLDILAMVASGFLQSSKSEKCAEESIKCDIVSSVEQARTSTDDGSGDGICPVSILDESALMIKESRLGNQKTIADYLCDGKLLQLNYSRHPKNLELFRSVWRKGFPLLVSGVNDLLDKGLWKPESFAVDFGDELADVVNCLTGDTLHQFSVGDFWKGFESIKDRPNDHLGSSMLLKLKDWPPGADFCDKMPKRFKDLMDAIPLPEYTRRDGQWNLVSRLPTNHFIKPDLGPKMYNAYGSAAAPSAGTTNLHLDMSDAVNVMVYVGVPCDPLLGEQEIQDALRTVDMACCEKTKHRVRQPNIIPGALWHIYAAEDADKIRRFLRKVAEERKLKYSVHNDPIHDQSFYLDYDMRKRLKADYDVTGFAICQCLGDAVFIPAGAPHQVLNLHSCVKVAEDFVSPERIGQCFNLTQEFRYLSDRHTNHEDKLQVKNIIYHAVKDSISVLTDKLEDLDTE